jgi:hypothetical protein
MNRRVFLKHGVIMGGTIVLGGVSCSRRSATSTAGTAIPTKEENMARYMRVWIEIRTGDVFRVDDENGKEGDFVIIDEKSPLQGLIRSRALPILSTHSSPGCGYVPHGDGYRRVCE